MTPNDTMTVIKRCGQLYKKVLKYMKVSKMRYSINFENKIKEINKDKPKQYYYIDTMGCALNENDSLKYRGIIEECGYTLTDDVDEANLVLFNTCAIRENAEEKLYGRLGQLKSRKKKAKETGKDFVICIVGCMSEQESVLAKIKESYPFVDVVLGTRSMARFAERVYIALKENKKTKGLDDEHIVLEDVPIAHVDGFKASVSIIYGCNNFCSYCIVPYVRGRERSRLPEDIIKDIESLAKDGYKEITLLGQNVNSYGNDFTGELEGYSFVDLLKEVDNVKEIEIIKFTSPHPKDFTDELIDYIAVNPKISRQLHLPLQAGNTKVLKDMNRKYTKEQYLALVEKIRKKVPDVSFSTDIIVGFPGETEEEFEDTLDVVKRVNFDMIYMFCYSVRIGTRAEKMENQIEESVKVERLERLKALYEKMVNENNNKKIGKVYKILIEGKSKNNELKYTGRTTDNKIVVFDAKKEDVGKIKEIKITENNLWYLTGEIV